jgi:phosphoserine phosphatase
VTPATLNASLPAILTADQFEAAVHALQPRIAVFDCDGTLWADDSGSAFMRWSIASGLLADDAIAWLNQRYARYQRGEVNELAICGEMVQVYQGMREADVRAAAAEFFPTHIEPGIFAEMQRVVARLQGQGVQIWAVSSTNNWVVEEGVKRFQIPPGRVLAAEVEVIDGVVTDRILDVPTDEGKVAALAHSGVSRPDAVFGNSIHDAAMLEIARRAFPVNPSPALVERSILQGWPVFHPVVRGAR